MEVKTKRDYSYFMTPEHVEDFKLFFDMNFQDFMEDYANEKQAHLTKGVFNKEIYWKIKKVFKNKAIFLQNKEYFDSLNTRLKNNGFKDVYLQKFDILAILTERNSLVYDISVLNKCVFSDYFTDMNDEVLLKKLNENEKENLLKNFKALLTIEFKERLEKKYPTKNIKTKGAKI